MTRMEESRTKIDQKVDEIYQICFEKSFLGEETEKIARVKDTIRYILLEGFLMGFDESAKNVDQILSVLKHKAQ